MHGGMDIQSGTRDTRWVSAFGRSRQRLAGVLNSAFAEGLLSEQTHVHRLGLLFGTQLIDEQQLIGDLTLRRARSRPLDVARHAWHGLLTSARSAAGFGQPAKLPMLLVLDRAEDDRLLIGRHPACDVVVADPSVSRRHAQLTFRDGVWVLQDLASTNGTAVNGERVGRAALHSGDLVELGAQPVQIE
jgi:FHA domain